MEESFDCDLQPDAKALLEHWSGLGGPVGLQSFTQEIETSLSRWIDDLSIVEVHDGPKRFLIRHHGKSTQLKIGDNLTGLYFEDVLQPIVRILALAPYEEAIRSRQPTRSTLAPNLYRGNFTQLDRLVLPFGDAGKVTTLVTWVGETKKCAYSGESIYDNLSALTDPAIGGGDLISLRVLSALD